MKKFTVNETSKMLSIPKDTLRYYDKLEIVSPTRGDNRYRYYSERDILGLKYVEVMKYADFSLIEIKAILSNKATGDEESLESSLELLGNKVVELKRRIELYRSVLDLFERVNGVMARKESPSDADEVNGLVDNLFHALHGPERIEQ